VLKMDYPDCRTHPFPLGYNFYIKGILSALFLVLIAADAIYCLRV